MIGRVALLVTFKKAKPKSQAYHEVIYVTCAAAEKRQQRALEEIK